VLVRRPGREIKKWAEELRLGQFAAKGDLRHTYRARLTEDISLKEQLHVYPFCMCINFITRFLSISP
jgi:hypothetical protein